MDRPVAVVLGGTGAIGKELVGQLLVDGFWKTVVTVGRREGQVPAAYPAEAFKAQLVTKAIDMDKMQEQAAEVFRGADNVFCTLGTTRKDAGSAEAFLKVDYEYVAAAAQLAKEGGAKHFSLVTAQGAKANLWAGKHAIFHGLLYAQTKGRAEEAVKAQGMPHTSIFRPGLLDRADLMRTGEKLAMRLGFGSIKTCDVAALLVRDAKRPEGEKPAAPVTFEMKEMVAAVQEGRAPRA